MGDDLGVAGTLAEAVSEKRLGSAHGARRLAGVAVGRGCRGPRSALFVASISALEVVEVAAQRAAALLP